MNIFLRLLLFIFFSSIADADVILARVNGINITENSVKEFLKSSNSSLDYAKLSKQQKIEVLQKIIQKELFLQMAKKDKIDKSAEFIKELEILKRELMLNLWLKKQANYMIVSDSDARKFYEQNIKSFTEPTRIKARHILVKNENEAKSIILALKHLHGTMLKNTFIAIAQNHSIDLQNRDNGGNLGEFAKDDMSADFSNAAWNLKAGTISLTPVKTTQGYHIIYVEDRIAPKAISFEKVKPQIVLILKQRQLQKYLLQLSSELGKKASIEIMLNAIK